jgi:cytochrome P450
MVRYLRYAFASMLASIIVRAIMHDPAVYTNPDDFDPGRFINPDGSIRDDSTWISAFGYGKRICPGRHFVDTTMFIVIASILSVFNIERVKRADGTPEEYSFTGTSITYVSHFLHREAWLIADSVDSSQWPKSVLVLNCPKGQKG